jgi:hypothetical protein
MSLVLIVEIKNQLEQSQKCIQVYHHHTGIADTVCFNQSISVSLRDITPGKPKDYLQVSVEPETAQPHFFYLIDVPAWVHFYLSIKGQSDISATFSGDRHIIKLSLSYDFWRIKIYRPFGSNFSIVDFVAILDRSISLSQSLSQPTCRDGNTRRKLPEYKKEE